MTERKYPHISGAADGLPLVFIIAGVTNSSVQLLSLIYFSASAAFIGSAFSQLVIFIGSLTPNTFMLLRLQRASEMTFASSQSAETLINRPLVCLSLVH